MPTSSAITKLLVALFALLVLLTVALILLSFPAGIYTFFFTKLSANFTASTQVEGVFIFIGPAVALLPVATSFGGVFLGLVAIYAAMFLLVAYQGRGIISAFSTAFRGGLSSLFSNYIVVTVMSIGFLVFTAALIDVFETSTGIPIGGLSGDNFQLFISTTIAPLREELGFRVVIIGLLAVVACLGRPWKTALNALWRPAAVYEGRNWDSATMGLIAAGLIISSLTFGAVHIYSGSGWEIGKLPEATYAGFVLGYLYIRYGFHVAVLAHWGVDYLGSVFFFMSQGGSGAAWAASFGSFFAQLVAVDLYDLIGLASFLIVGYFGLKWVLGRRAPQGEANVGKDGQVS